MRRVLPIPKQHGAWSVLLASFASGLVAGFGSGGGGWGPALILFVAIVSGFLAKHLLVLWLRRRRFLVWTTVFTSVSASSMIALVMHWGLWFFIPFAAVMAVAACVSIFFEYKRKDRTLLGELIGVWGLSPVAPAAYYASTGRADINALGVWLSCMIFFGASVVFVRHFVRHTALPVKRIGYAAAACTVVFVAMVAVVFSV